MKIIKNDSFKKVSGAREGAPGAPGEAAGPLGPHINYREERAKRATSGKFLLVGAITYVKIPPIR